jgi:Flp pilus assembly protein TadG
MILASSYCAGIKSEHRSERGQATIEFALLIVFLMIMVISILEMVLFMHTYNVLADSAKEGVRYAIVHGANNSYPAGPTCPCAKIDGDPAPSMTLAEDPSSTYGVVKTFAQFSLHSASNMTVTVTYPGGAATPANKTPNLVRVVVSYPYQLVFPVDWGPTVTVYAAAEGRIMN